MTEAQRGKRKKIIRTSLIITAVLFVASLLFGALACLAISFFQNNFQFNTKAWIETIFHTPILPAFMLSAILISLYLFIAKLLKGSLRDRIYRDNEDLENSRFLDFQEIEKNDNFTVTSWKKLPDINDGIPLSALYKYKEKELQVTLLSRQHTLVLGGTGSGKTTRFMIPTINILAQTKSKPIMIVTDPKGELYNNTHKKMEAQGYTVKLVDLAHPFSSARYNPLSYVVSQIKEYKKFSGSIPILDKESNLYSYVNKMYRTQGEALSFQKNALFIISDRIKTDVEDIFSTLFPIEDKNAPTWQKSARDFLIGCMFSLIELAKRDKITTDEVTFRNLYLLVDQNIATIESPENQLRLLLTKEFPGYREAASSAGTILNSQSTTLSGYVGHVSDFINTFANSAIQALTSGDDLYTFNLDEKPNIIYLTSEVTKNSKINQLVSVFISQLYKTITEKAEYNMHRTDGLQTSSKTLLRNCYFLIDEFGNLPAINNADKIVTFGRSFGVAFIPVIQDYSQLTSIYDNSKAAVIKSNCTCTIYIGTTDQPTLEEISKRLGNKKYAGKSANEGHDISSSYSAQTAPLMPPHELAVLNTDNNTGNFIILVGGNYPLRLKTVPWYMPVVSEFYGTPQKTFDEPEIISYDDTANLFNLANYFSKKGTKEENSKNTALSDDPDHESIPSVLKNEKGELLQITNEVGADEIYRTSIFMLFLHYKDWYPEKKLDQLHTASYEAQFDTLRRLAEDAHIRCDNVTIFNRTFVLNTFLRIRHDYLSQTDYFKGNIPSQTTFINTALSQGSRR